MSVPLPAADSRGIRHRMLAGVALAASITLAGCATAGSPRAGEGGGPFTAPEHPQTVRLAVQNLNFSDARLYAIRPSGRRYLGIVGGKSDAEFVMEWLLPEPLRIEIDLLAGPRCTTEVMQVDAGDILELQIPSVFPPGSICS